MQIGKRGDGSAVSLKYPRWGNEPVTLPYLRHVRCKKLSPRPNFLFLMGDRFGWQPVPNKIPHDEYKELTSHLQGERLALVEEWYQEDKNAIPVMYLLRERKKDWAEVELKLRDILREAVSRTGWSEDDRRKIKYEASATEQEFVRGVLDDPEASEHALCVLRTIQDLPKKADLDSFHRIVDVDRETGLVDGYAQFRLSRMKRDIQQMFPDNVLSYGTVWTKTGPEQNYIEQLCNDVYERLSQFIFLRIEEKKARELDSPIDQETKVHAAYAHSEAKAFIGRKRVLDDIQQYISEERSYPLLVHGLSGTGKSALMAKISEVIQKRYHHAVVLQRFIGATAASFELKTLAAGLCEELNRNYSISHNDGISIENTKDWQEWTAELRKNIATASEQQPLIIFIDGVNQLVNHVQAAHFMKQFATLPTYVHMVMSMTSDMTEDVKKALPVEAFYELGDMSVEGEALLNSWLDRKQRTLSSEQRDYVLQQYEQCPRPLFLKLMVERVIKWPSWTKTEQMIPTIKGAIEMYLADLERRHGLILTSRALSYLVTSRYGLSEQEWFTLVSQDIQILEEFEMRNPDSPEVKTLPMNIYSRFYWDLAPYLAERLHGDHHLFTFFHAFFREVIELRYLHDEETKRDIQAGFVSHFKKLPISLRKIEEYPWQLLQRQDWERLAEVLSENEFVVSAWELDKYDVLQYWSAIEENSSISKQEVYQGIVFKPNQYISSHLEVYAQLFLQTNCYKEALLLFEYLYSEAKSEQNRKKEIECLTNRATIMKIVQNHSKEALELIREAASIAREIGDKAALAGVLNDQAVLYGTTLKESLTIFEEAAKIVEETGDKASIIKYKHNQASICGQLGQLSRALGLYQEIEIQAKELGKKDDAANALLGQATIYAERGGTSKALGLLKEVEKIAQELGQRAIMTACLNDQAVVYQKRGDEPKALSLYKEAEIIARDCRDLGELTRISQPPSCNPYKSR